MLSYLNKQLTNKERKSVIRYMTQYKNLEAIIESKEMDLYPSHSVSYEEKPGKSSRKFYSEAEAFTIQNNEIDEYRRVKKRLDLAYESIKPLQRLIWDERFVEGRTDADVHYGHNIPKRTYYKEKNELICVVAECLGVGTN
ncbi:hypothetical protein J32TS6_19050 [Virgibacillus pantothenticus]|uniref:hypothetical protein n=1 Tax=Virgibacillus pantothenticus TaxID=1473 RepID=UPI001B02F8BF|nr:hypothetical protein [Virgibacillus pantothenticus]GIP63350.1 hypothetical protein J32TS6_19050 [Virgibacillus pantothenticus]